MGKLKLIALFEILIILVCTIMPTYCFKTNTKLTGKALERDVASWIQGYVPADNSLINPNSDNSDTINGGGCSHFAMSYALVKMGILQPSKGDTPITHINNARKHNAFFTDWGYFDFIHVNKVYKDVSYVGRDSKIEGMYNDKAVARLKLLMKKGYYIIAIVSSSGLTEAHCIFIDGINKNGTLSIGDSGFQGITWEDNYGQRSTYIKYVELLKCKGKDFNSQPSIYDGASLKRMSTVNNVNTKGKKVTEGDAYLGMPTKSKLMDKIKKPVFYTRATLTSKEKAVIATINGIKEDESISFFDIAKRVLSLIGLLMIIYALLLFVAFSVDRSNSFIDLSLVGVLTLGRIKIASKADMVLLGDKPYEKGYVSTVKFFIIVLVLLLMGSVLISGLLSFGLYKLIVRFI